jgi:hypothetical protein
LVEILEAFLSHLIDQSLVNLLLDEDQFIPLLPAMLTLFVIGFEGAAE